jgi:hypothetical protein
MRKESRMAESKAPSTTLDALFNHHLVEPPEGEDGLGPTLGQDVSAEREEREDAEHGAHSEDQGPGV